MEEIDDLVSALRGADGGERLRAARVLKGIAEREPARLAGHARVLVRAALDPGATDVRTRWQMTIVLGCLPLKGRDRLAVVDWLWERLEDASGLQRTFSMQALFDLSLADAGLRERVMAVVRRFAEEGTAAMRARARRLMREGG